MQKEQNYLDKLREEILERSGQDVFACIQCGRCTAGCPVVSSMDLLPREVFLYLQSGNEEKVINSKTPWICASCFTCAARCPRDLDLARVMEAVRAKLLRPRGTSSSLSPTEVPVDLLKELPQQALVSSFRKFAR